MKRMVSPNDLHKAAKDAMCGGADPVTNDDWQKCANFWACNIQSGLEEQVTVIMGMLFACPLPRQILVEIARFQATMKLGRPQ